MQRRVWISAAAVALTATVAAAGLFGKKSDRPPEKPDVTTQATAEPATQESSKKAAKSVKLWTEPLPIAHGPLPTGMANASAQGCSACHSEAHNQWQGSAHAAPPSDALLNAAAEANEPACVQCHAPLQEQHRQLWAYDSGDASTPRRFDNPGFSATLALEGVTCATCHVRDGAVVGTSKTPTPSPHPMVRSESLSDARSCAPCHQLTWDGADRPLYDTIGEWERSAYATADVGCTTCHMADGVGHAMALPLSQALSGILQVPPAALTRGGAPQEGTFILQNTGAGHAIPTGSPYRSLRLKVVLMGPAKKGTEAVVHSEVLSADLARTLSDEPPWRTVSDTRLAAGAQQVWPVSIGLPVDAPTGKYTLIASLFDVVAGEQSAEPVWQQRYPMPVN
ncbi:MAG: multiheme c-type cytochrome [Myxococcota bacterium]